jgi:hypothetical protein
MLSLARMFTDTHRGEVDRKVGRSGDAGTLPRDAGQPPDTATPVGSEPTETLNIDPTSNEVRELLRLMTS